MRELHKSEIKAAPPLMFPTEINHIAFFFFSIDIEVKLSTVSTSSRFRLPTFISFTWFPGNLDGGKKTLKDLNNVFVLVT